MDTSETYIKMSDCPEVQNHRKPKIEKMKDGRWHYGWDLENGDFIATKDMYEKEERRIEVKGTTIYSPSFYSTRKDANIDISTVGFDEGDGYKTKRFIWLPTQSQIQKMMGIKDGYDFFHGFVNKVFTNENYPYYRNKSPEQLWLAFYMHEKHQKTWDGEKWVKK